MPEETPILVDVISDVMCPWCFIGKRRLEAAIKSLPDISVEVRWHPYQLDPTLPKEGKDRQAYLSDKFGGADQAAALYDNIRTAGAEEGIDFQFDKITKSPNTLDSHRLILWAKSDDLQDEMVERLFQAYFLEGQDLTKPETLVKASADAGMQSELVEQLLETDSDLDKIESQIARVRDIGVTGVPCFIIDERFVVNGAEKPEMLAAAIMHAVQTRTETAAAAGS